MKNFLIILFASFFFSNASLAFPADVDSKKVYTIPPEVENFKYWYGDVDHGYLVYLGKEDIAGFETELHIHFSRKKVTKSLLILGPSGMDDYNCIRKYREVLKVLNKKYGHYTYQKEVKDPIIDDLISFSVCTPIRLELYAVNTYWKSKNLEIIATLLGDEIGFYIEIEYIIDKNSKPSKLKKIL